MPHCKAAILVLSCFLALVTPAAWAAPPSVGNSCTDYAEGANACYNNGCFICSSGVWSAQPLLIGNTSASCTSALAGQMRWTGTDMEYCNGTVWGSFSACGNGSPTAFGFNDQTGVDLSTSITSNAITLSGFSGPLTATCTGCTAIARNGTWGGTSVAGFVAGDQIKIQLTSSSSIATTTTASVTIGTTTSGT